MNWKIRFKVNGPEDDSISTMHIDAESLRDACKAVLNNYRSAIILSYQQDDGMERTFDFSEIRSKPYPVNPEMFSLGK